MQNDINPIRPSSTNKFLISHHLVILLRFIILTVSVVCVCVYFDCNRLGPWILIWKGTGLPLSPNLEKMYLRYGDMMSSVFVSQHTNVANTINIKVAYLTYYIFYTYRSQRRDIVKPLQRGGFERNFKGTLENL